MAVCLSVDVFILLVDLTFKIVAINLLDPQVTDSDYLAFLSMLKLKVPDIQNSQFDVTRTIVITKCIQKYIKYYLEEN